MPFENRTIRQPDMFGPFENRTSPVFGWLLYVLPGFGEAGIGVGIGSGLSGVLCGGVREDCL